MSKEIKVVRLEPMSKFDNQDCVCQCVIGVVMTEGEHSAYIDGVKHFSMPMPTVAEFQAGAGDIVNQFIANQGWVANLENQIESSKKRDVATQGFEAPEITVDTSVEPESGSPAAPAEEESTEGESSGE